MQDGKNAFLDSNIVLYALDSDTSKRNIAWQLLFNKPSISLQVINECRNVLSRKRQWPIEDVAATVSRLLAFVRIEPIDIATVRSAWKLQSRYRFSYYDSLIVASALSANCAILYSEDMQHEQVIEGRLTIINPFFQQN